MHDRLALQELGLSAAVVEQFVRTLAADFIRTGQGRDALGADISKVFHRESELLQCLQSAGVGAEAMVLASAQPIFAKFVFGSTGEATGVAKRIKGNLDSLVG